MFLTPLLKIIVYINEWMIKLMKIIAYMSTELIYE